LIDRAESPAGFATISQLGRLRGVDKAAISRRVARLEAQGLLKSQRGARGTKIVNIAEFDRAAGEATDAIRELNGRGAGATQSGLARGDGTAIEPADPILSREQARRASYDADMKKLDLEERLGQLVSVDRVQRAFADCAQIVAQAAGQMVGRAEENAAAVAKDGVQGARAWLKRATHDLCEAVARSATLLADEAQSDAQASLSIGQESAASAVAE
jgi:DNA-binding MarR family transcriptional regulator